MPQVKPDATQLSILICLQTKLVVLAKSIALLFAVVKSVLVFDVVNVPWISKSVKLQLTAS
jgi:hypothetical protein